MSLDRLLDEYRDRVGESPPIVGYDQALMGAKLARLIREALRRGRPIDTPELKRATGIDYPPGVLI